VDYNTTKILTDCVINELKEENLEFVTPDLFKKLMGSVLKKIIPSVNHENLLKEIKNENKKGNIFSLCFVGVNGVGKSTSLSKVCYWFLQKGLRVYIAACDTFRAGAVEQLKVHVQRFRESNYDVGFYEKGYGKDDASVARTAILNATKENYDVILIDTAGRMHNKKTLMDSLSKLIKINNPNHIVYVGEALVGTDSLIHIEEFNKAIGKGMENRRINSIILTKVDTVDEKIGQILNMTFSSNSPVLFLGTGQTNSDLTKIDSEEIINVLMS
jgi:signal recognition particle receptor subunit alpha